MKVRCASAGGRLAFEHPEEIVEAWLPEDVPGAFSRIEAALDAGTYVAGFFSYELGTVLVPRQAGSREASVPLISIGIFGAPEAEPRRVPVAVTTGPLYPEVSQTRYERDLADIVAAIAEGDVYQVNYAVPFAFSYRGEPLDLYATLTAHDAYPYAAYVEREAYAVVSCSPELFIERTPTRIVTKPMKGTARREHATALADPKNRAEHIMIVDLLRNDLHRISSAVTIERLCERETYPNFVTMTSTIAAGVSEDLTLERMLGALFPCGSITGAPKVAAMNAIAAMEGRSRGLFCGSIGYMAPDRSGTWNVAIRTATIDRRTSRGTLFVGGGIVADSSASAEWAEILTKRSFFAELAPEYALIETLARERDGTLRNLEAHLARLRAAADALHFSYDERALREALHAQQATAPIILRVQVERDGSFVLSRRPLPFLAEPVTVCWARETLDAAEPLLRYKTTWRPHYDAALAHAESIDCFDAILCNERGDVADGARTTLFLREGDRLFTPPLESGALPGVLRARMLASGAAVERHLTRSDVADADDVYVGNSTRGLLRARFVARSDT